MAAAGAVRRVRLTRLYESRTAFFGRPVVHKDGGPLRVPGGWRLSLCPGGSPESSPVKDGSRSGPDRDATFLAGERAQAPRTAWVGAAAPLTPSARSAAGTEPLRPAAPELAVGAKRPEGAVSARDPQTRQSHRPLQHFTGAGASMRWGRSSPAAEDNRGDRKA